MNTYRYRIITTAGEAEGSILAKNEDTARARLASQYAGELLDADDNTFNNDVESIELTLVP